MCNDQVKIFICLADSFRIDPGDGLLIQGRNDLRNNKTRGDDVQK